MLLDTFNTPFAYFTSTQDWIIIAVIAMVLFGGKKIPEMARGIGEGIREFKNSVNGINEEPASTEMVKGTTAPASQERSAEVQ